MASPSDPRPRGLFPPENVQLTAPPRISHEGARRIVVRDGCKHLDELEMQLIVARGLKRAGRDTDAQWAVLILGYGRPMAESSSRSTTTREPCPAAGALRRFVTRAARPGARRLTSAYARSPRSGPRSKSTSPGWGMAGRSNSPLRQSRRWSALGFSQYIAARPRSWPTCPQPQGQVRVPAGSAQRSEPGPGAGAGGSLVNLQAGC
jgi:hypothetical protein